MRLRPERLRDHGAVRGLVAAAFRDAPHAGGCEHLLVDALRDAGALALALVAEDDDAIVGHVAFSAVMIDGAATAWYGLGPLAVRPDRQRRGIGSALVREGLSRLGAAGAAGCVVLGDPAYYGRFGFAATSRLRLDGAPAAYFLARSLGGPTPAGKVDYHPAFQAFG